MACTMGSGICKEKVYLFILIKPAGMAQLHHTCMAPWRHKQLVMDLPSMAVDHLTNTSHSGCAAVPPVPPPKISWTPRNTRRWSAGPSTPGRSNRLTSPTRR